MMLQVRSFILTLAIAVLATLTVVCDGAEPGDVIAKSDLSPIPLSSKADKLVPVVKQVIANQLVKRFGDGVTFVHSDKLPVDFGNSDTTQGQEHGWILSLGQRVFNKNCAACHGLFGDGKPIEGQKQLSSSPRDFRSGLFKWKSTSLQNKASRHDLNETIRLGLPGTDMPPFATLTLDARRGVVEYVRWLSMRHEVEQRVIDGAIGRDATTIRDDVDEAFSSVVEAWTTAESSDVIVRPNIEPKLTAELVEQGKTVFESKKTRCFACHGAEGRGDGPATKDFWFQPGSASKYRDAGLHDNWGKKLIPRDFTTEPFRGGENAEEIFRRISVGIPGTPMPSYRSLLKESEMWSVAAYVLSLRPAKVDFVHRAPPPSPGTK